MHLKWFSRVLVPALVLVGLIGLNQLEARGPLYAALDNSASSDASDLFDSIEKKIQLHTLDNGLQVIMLDQELAPVSALYIKILAGGSDETMETAGIAHMLEHMLFKGTEQIGTRDYEAEKKYLELIQQWSRHLDRWRKKLEQARASGDEEAIKDAQSKVQLWKYRLQLATKEAEWADKRKPWYRKIFSRSG